MCFIQSQTVVCSHFGKKEKEKYFIILGGTRAVGYLTHYETQEERSDLLSV